MPRTEDLMDHEIAMIAKAFLKFRSDLEDAMPAENLGTALRSMKLIPSEEEIELYVNTYAKNGYISQKSFLIIGADCWVDDKALEELIWKAFHQFDKVCSGKISQDMMRKILLEMGEPIPDKEAEAIIKGALGKDGFVAYSQLILQWTK